MKTVHILIAFVLGMLAALPASASAAPADWTEYPNNPVLTRGASGSWDSWNTISVSVVYDAGQYHMWYQGSTQSGSARIGYATSPDGLQWTKYGSSPVFSAGASGSWDSTAVSAPCVRKVGDEWKMWYTGTGTSGSGGVGLATSPDGVHWTRYASNPVFVKGSTGSWDSASPARPSVLILNDVYHMWYGSNGAIGYASSSDGIHWTRSSLNPILSPGSAGAWDGAAIHAPTVIFYGGRYHMWYQGIVTASVMRPNFGHAEAADPEHWTRDPANPVLQYGASGTWDDNGIFYPSVLARDGKLRMWFHGNDSSTGPLSVGYADSLLPAAFFAYLPYVLKAPPQAPPAAPVLNAINNPDRGFLLRCHLEHGELCVQLCTPRGRRSHL